MDSLNLITTTSQNKLTHKTLQFAIMYGYIIPVQFGFPNVTSKKKIASSI